MTRRTVSEGATLPAIHALHLADLVERWGVSGLALLKGSGLRRADLAQPGRRLSIAVMGGLVERARMLTKEPALGVYFGLQTRISWHGYLGLAAMTAQTVRGALELTTRFSPTRTGALSLSLETDGAEARLIIDERAQLGAARDTILLSILVGIWQLGCSLTGRQLTGTAELAMPAPPYLAKFKDLMPGRVLFDKPAHRLVFDAAILDLPLVSADPAALALTRAQCERELEALGFEGPFQDRVRALALSGSGGARSLEEVAAQLGLSSRTLKRRLAEMGTSFSDILAKERQQRALSLLRTSSLPLVDVAEHLGYSDVANFSRAFRRWTGGTPGALRRTKRKAGRKRG
jgi:AraC-like DNA-binding protein